MPLTRDQIDARLKLDAAIASMDASAFDDALSAAITSGLGEELVESLLSVVHETWHTEHENIVSTLQGLQPPQAVADLERLAHARFAYLDYDEYFGLARKCTWALADIGTPEAKEALRRLAADRNEAIAGYAARRLDRWHEERRRKRSV